jgi:hypothetical protein
MGRVDAFSLPGCRCFFWSDDHGPPHFHVLKSGDWEVRVFFQEEPAIVEVQWERDRFPGRIERELLNLVAEHRQALWTEWNQKVKAGDD